MSDKILLAHGSGGKLMHDLIEETLVKPLGNEVLCRLDDAAVVELGGRLAFTTDSYVVSPIFFPGGDIGRLAVCGTVNDLATSGARPVYLSLSFVIEEGFLLDDLRRIVESIAAAAREADVTVVTGDTKVVERGCADRLFVNTSGIGVLPAGVHLSGANARPGDKVLISGPIGDHGVAVMSVREGLSFSLPVQSDCAPLNAMVAAMLGASPNLHVLRDPTRGGVASTLNEIAGQSRAGIVIEEAAIPVRREVRAACEMLGLDPLYVANEGKMVAVVASEDAQAVLAAMRASRYGQDAAAIGEVRAEQPGRVVMRTTLGTSRIIDMMVGELLPRIC